MAAKKVTKKKYLKILNKRCVPSRMFRTARCSSSTLSGRRPSTPPVWSPTSPTASQSSQSWLPFNTKPPASSSLSVAETGWAMAEARMLYE